MSIERQPKGMPAGGQFAASSHPEATVGLTEGQLMPPAGFEPELVDGRVRASEASQYLGQNLAAARQFAKSGGLEDSDYFAGRARANVEVAAALLSPEPGPEEIRGKGRYERSSIPEGHVPEHEQHFKENPLTGRRCQQLAGYFLNEAIEAKKKVPGSSTSAWTDEEWEQQGAFNVYVEAAARFSDGVERRRRGGVSEDEKRIIERIKDGETDADHILKTIWDED